MLNEEKNKKELPTKDIMSMKNQGLSNSEIINSLQKQRYSPEEISDAMNQVEIKNSVESPANYQELTETPRLTNAPTPTQSETTIKEVPPTTETFDKTDYANQPVQETDIEEIEEIIESVVQEKWEDLLKDVGDIALWKEKIDTEVLSIKQEILRTQQRFENLQTAFIGKISEYGQGIIDLGSEIKALEKVFEKIMSPLTKNIKELSKITEELKKR